MDISNNEFSGSIPPSLYNLKGLRYVLAINNFVNGTISPEISNLNKLVWFLVTNNRLTGDIPGTVSNLRNLGRYKHFLDSHLKLSILLGSFLILILAFLTFGCMIFLFSDVFRINHNGFSGNITDEICDLKIQDFIADCRNDDGGDVEIICNCCSACCNPGQSGNCIKE